MSLEPIPTLHAIKGHDCLQKPGLQNMLDFTHPFAWHWSQAPIMFFIVKYTLSYNK